MNRLTIAIAVLTALTGLAGAGPSMPQPVTAEPLVIQIRGCHADVRRHYVPQYGRTVTHYHRRDCRPVRVGGGVPPSRDCHRDVRTHRINGVLVRHRHVGPNCRVRVAGRVN